MTIGLCAAVSLTGCPGTLNPDDFIDGGRAQKDAQTLLAQSCGTTNCHDATAQAQAGLDLVSPNVESRVVGVNAVGIGCQSDILVVAGDPDGSYLLDKVLKVPGICGFQMPVVGTLSESDVEILRDWIIDLGGSGEGTLDGG
ncbi:MAG: hypothetical protein WCE62_00325 [Polyangiales bacterium]